MWNLKTAAVVFAIALYVVWDNLDRIVVLFW
jgi:hypothetical protein